MLYDTMHVHSKISSTMASFLVSMFMTAEFMRGVRRDSLMPVQLHSLNIDPLLLSDREDMLR